MGTAPETPTKLTGFDRAMLCLLGLLIILGLGAVLNAPFLPILVSMLTFCLGVEIYGRLENPHKVANTTGLETSAEVQIFNQRAIADNLSEAVWIVNSREQIIYANKAATVLFGKTPFGRRLSTVLRDPSVTELVKAILIGQDGEAVDYHSSVPVDRHLRVTATPIEVANADSPPRRFAMIVFYDVTDLVKFALTQGDFLANASHELKTPVASLLGYIETLRGHAKDDPEARTKFLAIMQGQAERMQRLINDLLSLRQIEQSEHIAPSATADISAAVKVALDTVLPLAKTRGVILSSDGPKTLKVKGHQDELVQLCLNIIDNAVKMTPKGKQVSVSVSATKQWRSQDFMAPTPQALSSEEGLTRPLAKNRQIVIPQPSENGYALIRFRDNGPGFAAKHIPRLGERFYRIAGDRTSQDKGTGLGLAIVKHIALRHRGGLLVSSVSAQAQAENLLLESLSGDVDKPEQDPQETGTEFTLILPLSPSVTQQN